MTPESKAIIDEVLGDAIFKTHERRCELMRQSETMASRPGGRKTAIDMRGEAGRLSDRLKTLKAAREELKNLANVRPNSPTGSDIFS